MLRPKWVIGHVIVVVVVVGCVALAFWQYRRLHERQAQNRVVRERLAQAPRPIGDVVATGAAVKGSELEDRWVRATGTYEPASEVLVRGQSDDTGPGFWSVVPLRLDDGRAVLVVRGWIPFPLGSTDARPVPGAEPPAGRVTVTGTLQPSQSRGLFGTTDPATGTLREVARVDVARLARQTDGTVLPVWLQLRTQDPPSSAQLPKPLALPGLDDGPHLSYMIQWIAFAAVFTIGWVLVVRRATRRRPRSAGTDAAGADTVGSIAGSRRNGVTSGA